jgi:hypothetical protein
VTFVVIVDVLVYNPYLALPRLPGVQLAASEKLE